MKKNKRWQILLILGALIITASGCEHQPKENPSVTMSPAPNSISEMQNETNSGIYNTAFEKYSDITELGVIINNPTEEDLKQLQVKESYGDDKQESILIIPKYNGSKITVSSAEYTGEQYIAKDTLFSNENTPAGYGLQLFAERPEGIPKLVVTITYQNMIYKYVVASNGKEGNNGVEYLKLEKDTGKDKKGDQITAIKESTYLSGLNLFSSSELDIDKDGKNETVELYCDGTLGADGEYSGDDGQTWALVLRKGEEIYPLFDKAFIQLGKLGYVIYQDYDDYDKMHIIIEYKTGTAIYYYDCTYDDESKDIFRNDFFDATNINLISSWQ